MHDFVKLTIVEVRRETPSTVSVAFAVPPELQQSFAFRPGQHLNLRTVFDGEEVRRSYSICSDPGEPPLRIAIKQIDGGHFSVWANSTLKAGMEIDVMPPAGRFVLVPGEGAPRHVVGFASGAGITPIIGMVRHALRHEPRTDVTLVYGNRTLDDVIFGEEIEGLKDRYVDRFTLVQVLSRGDNAETPLFDGRIDAPKVRALCERLIPVSGITQAYICGPGSMIKDVRNTLLALGVPRDRVHHEFFAAGGGAYRAKDAVQPSAQPETAIGAEIVAIIDGARYRFTARPGEAVIDAAIRAGVKAPYACKGGMCSTCRARVLEGSAEMAVNYSLETWETERGFVLTCQSVATSPRLVLDYDQL